MFVSPILGSRYVIPFAFCFFQFNVLRFLLLSLFRSFFFSLNPFSFFNVFFSLFQIFFPKFPNFFYRMRDFDFDGLFSDLAVQSFRISFKYLSLTVEFRPFYKSSDSLCLDYFWFFSVLFFRLPLWYLFHFVFCSISSLPGTPFLPSSLTLIPFDKSSSIDNFRLRTSISFWILSFQVGFLWLFLFLYFFFIPHLFGIAFAAEYVNSFNVVLSFGLIPLIFWSSSILPMLMLSLFFLLVSSFTSCSRSSKLMLCVLKNSSRISIFFLQLSLYFLLQRFHYPQIILFVAQADLYCLYNFHVLFFLWCFLHALELGFPTSLLHLLGFVILCLLVARPFQSLELLLYSFSLYLL